MLNFKYSCDQNKFHAQTIVRQKNNLKNLLECKNDHRFWKYICDWLDAKKCPPQILVSQSKDTFEQWMNPPIIFPSSFDQTQWELHKTMASLIPSITVDHTSGHHFSACFSLEDIEWANQEIKKHPPNSASGNDCVSYNEIDTIPNEDLLVLFQQCIDSGDAPDAWLTTIIIGILKIGKPANNPESYCLVGLESCLLKMVTLLIAKRIHNWVQENDLLPLSQNGFREGY